MKKFTDGEKYTTIEQSKILEPIMDKLGVKPDAHYRSDMKQVYVDMNYFTEDSIALFRLDTLLWVLPDSDVFVMKLGKKVKSRLSDTNAHTLFIDALTSKGSKAIAAAAELIKLLDENDFAVIEEE